MNLPNLLTLVRIGLSGFLVVLLWTPGLAAKTAALAVFIVAALTDLFDGRIARRRGLVTPFGVILDPIADKLLVLAALFSFVKLGLAPFWMVALIALREIGITALRLAALAKGTALAAEAAGKLKAASQMVAISLGFLFLIGRETNPQAAWIPGGLKAIQLLIGVTLLLTLTSGISFLWHQRRQLFG